MAKLIIEVEVAIDPSREDPLEVAAYLLDTGADDPSPELLSAEWVEDKP